jgi:hypothetical protein
MLILEFSHVQNSVLGHAYDQFSFNVIPKMGQLVANDAASYQYLVESIRRFPKQVRVFCYLCGDFFVSSRTQFLLNEPLSYFHPRLILLIFPIPWWVVRNRMNWCK